MHSYTYQPNCSQTTQHILDTYDKSPKLESFSPPPVAAAAGASDEAVKPLPPPARKHVERINELATAKLAEIVRRAGAGTGAGADSNEGSGTARRPEKGWEGYEDGELRAARELLDGMKG